MAYSMQKTEVCYIEGRIHCHSLYIPLAEEKTKTVLFTEPFTVIQ